MPEIVNIEVGETEVALPVDKKKLGEFISGLLGQPQSLERKFEEPFSADHIWFVNFFTLVFQRIQQQNAPEPLAFEASIRYRDKVERKITSWQAFQHFAETQNIISVGVKFHVALLIQFPNKHVPERQEIIIDFNSNESRQSFTESLIGRDPIVGRITVEIRHTERTWADDIWRVVETELANIQVIENSLKKRLRKLIFPIVSLSFPFMMLASLLYTEWAKRGARESLRTKILATLDAGKLDMQTLHNKIDVLMTNAVSSADSKFGDETVMMYSIMVSALLFFSGIFLARPNPSFVVLSKAAETNRKDTLERLKRKNFWLLVSLIGSIALGVIGNFVYDKIK